MPPRTATSRQRQASAANFIGGTTKQFDWLTNGRSRHCRSPPAIRCSISSEAVTCSGCTQLDPPGLGGPGTQAEQGFESHLKGSGLTGGDPAPLEKRKWPSHITHTP